MARNVGLERRLFVLRDNMKSAAWRLGMNVSLPDNNAAVRQLNMALVKDLEAEAGIGRGR